MPVNLRRKPGLQYPVVVTDPAAPNSGDAVRFGSLTGVALTDEGAGGNGATETTVDFGFGVWALPVTAEAGAISVGDVLFYDDAIHKVNNDSANGYFFGFALEAIAAGEVTIDVLHVPSPGAGTLGAGTVGAANLAANAVVAAKIAADAVTTVKILNANVTAAKLADAILTGLKAAAVADANTTGGIPLLHRIDVADAATGDVDVVLDHKTRVIDAWAVKTGGAGGAANTVQVKNGANAITDAMSININDQAVARAASIDDAEHEIAAGGTLRVTRTKAGGNAACVVYVLGIRVA